MTSNKILRLCALVALLLVGGGAALLTQSSPEADATQVTVYKLASCGCCNDWVKHLREAGFAVATHNLEKMNEIKAANDVPPTLSSCHTAIVDGYVVERHVPADDIKRLLLERPDIVGLTAPGMPQKSPGMQAEGLPTKGYRVLAFDDKGATSVFTDYRSVQP